MQLGPIVDYLHNARVPFRLSSYPSEEPQPLAVHPLASGGVLVDTRLLVVDGRPVLAVFPAGEQIDFPAMSTMLGGTVLEGTTDALPDELRHATGCIPPLGQLFGLPVVFDERIARAGIVVFRAFDASDYFAIPYDDLARLEQPRVASFASAGELRA